MKFVHASDFHQNEKNLETVVNAAKKEDNVLVFSGDWFNCHEAVNKQKEKRNKDYDDLVKDKEAQDEMRDEAISSYKTLNEKTKGLDFLLIPGNHDYKEIYDEVEGKFLNKESAEIKGIKFAGGLNTYEVARGVDSEYLVDMKDDISIDQVAHHLQEKGLIKEGMSETELQNVFGKALETFGKQTEIYERLKDQEIDYLVTHKGPMGELTNNNPSGVGTTNLIKEKGCNNLCGHFHKETISKIENSTGFRAGPNQFYTIDVNEDSKKINYVDVYEYEQAA